MILAQVQPLAATDTLLYTAPSGGAALGCIFVCNRSAGTPTFRLRATRPTEETAASKQYLYFDTATLANQSSAISLGLTLAAGESIYCQASTANVNFMIFGETL